MKKCLLSFLLLTPMILFSFQSTETVKRNPVDSSLVIKGKTSLGDSLVRKLWSHIADHNWSRVKSEMHSTFSSIDFFSQQLDRSEQIQSWKSLHIQVAEPDVLRVLSPKKHVLIVVYTLLLLSESQDPTSAVPVPHVSVFKKTNGKWLLIDDADYNNTVTIPEA